ncbi:MAG: hypothetical protein QNK71_00025 [Amylibacter sp.]
MTRNPTPLIAALLDKRSLLFLSYKPQFGGHDPGENLDPLELSLRANEGS